MEDGALIQTFVESRSEQAFAELVQRHAGLVYSTAFRVVGNDQLARDVAQEVFIKLARTARTLRNANALPAWLYRVAHAQAVNALRTEARRRHREQEAMETIQTEMMPDQESVWTALKPMLDEALAALSKADQAALVLRYFSGKNLLEVGQALGLSEEAARKRVGRALEKLRASFARRGVQVSSTALASILAVNVVHAAPAGLTASLVASSVAAATTTGSAGFLAVLTHTLLMTKTTAIIVAAVAAGALVAPLLLKQAPAPASEQVVATAAPAGSAPAPALVPTQTQPKAATTAGRALLERVASLSQLTQHEIDTYVTQNKRSAESLLAAYRASGDKTWLAEAATKFPNDPNVQYEVVASQAARESQRQWIETYKSSSPDNALAWYLSALDYFKVGDKERAMQELAEATRKPAFRAELAPTLQALEELNISAGRAADEAKVVAFQNCAQAPHLPQMKELAKTVKEAAQQYRSGGDAASADALAGMGLVLGSHLSAGSGSQTLINQLVGIAIEKSFLQQLGSGVAQDPLGRPVAEVSAEIDRHQRTIKEYSQMMGGMMSRLDDTEWALYMERVKLYGEESALAWLKEKHGKQ